MTGKYQTKRQKQLDTILSLANTDSIAVLELGEK
jgi:hypothetical protein